MDKGIKFKLNKKGLTELMKSAPMLDHLNAVADFIAGAAGEGYLKQKAHPITFTSIASVKTGTFKARLDNSKYNSLEKAIGSSGCDRHK